jgi:hypothetical protein
MPKRRQKKRREIRKTLLLSQLNGTKGGKRVKERERERKKEKEKERPKGDGDGDGQTQRGEREA